ncbi:HNH endonuclease [Nocardia stercoris]|uniref:HNH endonuclease n=1 Tax=Nocardia stercoris TaxID=2483361 RepID=A0A3M2L4P0_9NOCA|nr:HNH endonuclease [Nocardia stercoris]
MAAAGLAVLAGVAGGCGGPGPDRPAPGSPTRAELDRLLATVRVVPLRPHPGGYDRGCGADQSCVFGPAWTDDHDGPGGRDGCDTRNSVLSRQLSAVRFRPGTGRCVVESGTMVDPYTGRRLAFDHARARTIQIDHIYPLAAAWDLGAANWPVAQRIRFANDIDLNLLAVDGSTNQDKGDRTPADWLPPARLYRCFYAGKYLTAATAYHLPVTAADHRALRAVASGCP